MDSLFALAAFSTTDIISISRLRKIKNSGVSLDDFLNFSVKDQMNILEVKSEKAQKELSLMKSKAGAVLQSCKKKNIKLLPYDDPYYPQILRSVPEPPYLLYVKGDFNPQIPLIAVIGTRKSTHEAEEINRWFCRTFAEYGFGVVSGLAYGHDSIAAQTMIRSEGYTVGVLGTAIDVIYPSSLYRLYEEVAEYGAIISEYPPGMVGAKWRFPRRNRIVSGLAYALCVVQAPKSSGTLITTKIAEEQGRDVYVVPGNPMKMQYHGSNNLLELGAKMALNPEVIINDLMQSIPDAEVRRFLRSFRRISENDNSSPKQYKPDPALRPEEQKVLLLTENPISADDLLRELDMNPAGFNAMMSILEIKGFLRQIPGGLYQRIET